MSLCDNYHYVISFAIRPSGCKYAIKLIDYLNLLSVLHTQWHNAIYTAWILGIYKPGRY